MKFDLRKPIIDYDGKTVSSGPNEGEVVTMRNIITSALNSQRMGPDRQPLPPRTPEDKTRIYEILQKVWHRWKVDFTHDECAFIQTTAGEVLDPLTYGRLVDFLEGREWMLPVPMEDQAVEDEEEKKAKKS